MGKLSESDGQIGPAEGDMAYYDEKRASPLIAAELGPGCTPQRS
jgi:hypothetical protein